MYSYDYDPNTYTLYIYDEGTLVKMIENVSSKTEAERLFDEYVDCEGIYFANDYSQSR